MADLYANYAELAAARQIGVDYRLLVRSPAGSRMAHIAIHGGGIEPGTLEIADYLAASAHRFYAFDGMLSSGNSDLHITSTNYDEPQALTLVGAADYVMSWHGAAGSEPVTYVGGLDTDTVTRVQQALEDAGFTVLPPDDPINGDSPDNICNKGARSMGVQLELTTALRESFFEDFTRTGRESGVRTSEFYTYMAAVQSALNGLDVPSKALGVSGKVARPKTGGALATGDYGIPALSSLTLDGMPLDAVNDALRLQHGRRTTAATERFWSSPPRANGDRVREVFEFSLGSERPVNRVSFGLARFPQRAWLQWRDQDGVWWPAQHSKTGTPVQISIVDSLPAVIPAGVPDAQHLHPQHFGTGHWMDQMVDISPVTTSHFRLVMTRLPSSSAPRGTDGLPVDYSLGVKDASVSYRVSSVEDLPWLPQEDYEHTVPITGSEDILGSQVEYLIRRNRASNLVAPAKGVWRCQPQPTPDAVASLYLDLRGPDGSPQVLDRLYLDPLTSGPSVNLYYTEGENIPERFPPLDTPLAMPLVRPSSKVPVADGDGLLFTDPDTYLEVDNRATQFDPGKPFLLAGVVQPQFTSQDEGVYTILDNGALTVTIEQGAVAARLGERTCVLNPVRFGVNSSVPFAVAYDGSVLTVKTPWDLRSQTEVYVHRDGLPPVLRVGAPLDGSGGGAMRITALMVARGRPQDIDHIDGFWQVPTGYVLNPGYGQDPAEHTSANTLIRFDPSLITPGEESVCPWGMIGGPAVDYESMSWTPIAGDFSVRKGVLKFRPIKARHMKLEFTNLQPITITPSPGSPPVPVKQFPEDTSQGGTTKAAPQESVSGAAPSGTAVATEQGAPFDYVDTYRVGQSLPAQDAPYRPTEALYAPDPLQAQDLRRTTRSFPYQPLPRQHAPRFTSTGVHRYHVSHIALDTKVAYSVAIREVRAYLSDPVAERDTEQYVELFHDTSLLSDYSENDTRGWTHTGSAMVTHNDPPWRGAELTSRTFVSRRRVLGVQFAAQTSPPRQLVADPDFENPSLRHWRPVGDASISSSGRYASSIGQMAEVVRGHALSSWGALEDRFFIWGAIEDSNPLPYRPLWSEVTNSVSEADNGGIESLRGVTPAPGGRLYAAARVYTDKALAEPLRLQIVNGDGRILAEAEKRVDAAQVAEWYVGVTVHGQPPGDSPTWDSVSTTETGDGATWLDVELLGSWADITQNWDVDHVHDVRVRLIQQGAAGTGQWLVDSLVLYNDPLVWEVSRDGGVEWHEMAGIKNNPHGVFQFPDLPAADRTGGTQLRWRVTGYDQDLALSSVVLRPWYATLTGAVPYQDTLQASGAASSLADYYPPVEQDPYFQAWPHPIPQDWWLAARQWAAQNTPLTPPLPSVTLPDAVVEGTDEGAPPSPARHVLADAFVLNR